MRAGDYERDPESGLLVPRRRGVLHARPQWMCGPGFFGGGKPSYIGTILADAPGAYWPLNETSGTVAADLSGNSNAGTYSGVILNAAPISARLGPSANFSTINAYVEGPATAVGMPAGNSAYTLEGWFYFSSTSSVASIIGYGTYGTTRAVNMVRVTTGASGQIANQWWGDDTAGTQSLPLNTASHIVVTYDGASTRKIYLNAGLLLTNTTGGAHAVPNANNLTLGAILTSSGWSGGASAAIGLYSNIAVYGYALSAAQILAHYNAA